MSKYDSIEKVVAKLHVIRDSCTGVFNSESTNSHLLWFQGAEAMLIEVVDDLQRALDAVKRVEEEETSDQASIEEDASVEQPETEGD
jgi:methionine synthase I (cobalamin-dependent)